MRDFWAFGRDMYGWRTLVAVAVAIAISAGLSFLLDIPDEWLVVWGMPFGCAGVLLGQLWKETQR